MIVSQYDIYVKIAVLHALSPPLLHFAIQSIFIVSLQKTPNFQGFLTATQRILVGSESGQEEMK